MVFDKIREYFVSFAANLMLKTLNPDSLLENFLGLAKSMSFDGFDNIRHYFATFCGKLDVENPKSR